MRILNFCLIALHYLSHKEIEFYQYGFSFVRSIQWNSVPAQDNTRTSSRCFTMRLHNIWGEANYKDCCINYVVTLWRFYCRHINSARNVNKTFAASIALNMPATDKRDPSTASSIWWPWSPLPSSSSSSLRAWQRKRASEGERGDWQPPARVKLLARTSTAAAEGCSRTGARSTCQRAEASLQSGQDLLTTEQARKSGMRGVAPRYGKSTAMHTCATASLYATRAQPQTTS